MDEETKVGAQLIGSLVRYHEDIRRLLTKLTLANVALEDSYDKTTEGSLLYRVYDKEVKQQLIMKGKNAANELLNLMKLTEEVAQKVSEDIEEG